MKKIGFIVALEGETNNLKKELNVTKQEKVGNCSVYTIKNKNNIAYLIYSGVGKANAAHATSILINRYKVSTIYNIGSTCSINKSHNVGDVCVIKYAIYGDVDAHVFGYKFNQVPHEPLMFSTTGKLNNKIGKLLNNKTFKLHKNMYLSTTDSFIDKHNFKNFKLNKTTNLIDMEGAAIAQICSKYNNVSYSIIKIVSDVYNKKTASSKQWKDNNILFKNIISKIIKTIIND